MASSERLDTLGVRGVWLLLSDAEGTSVDGRTGAGVGGFGGRSHARVGRGIGFAPGYSIALNRWDGL